MRKSSFSTFVLLAVLSLLLTVSGSLVLAQDAPVTLRVLIHQNPSMVDFMNEFNATFTAAHPNITIDMAVVNAGDLAQVTQTRLAANDIDVIDLFGFANSAQPYMTNVTPPNWQASIDAGLLMDLTDQPFISN